ncbi:MAG: terminase TerL endonuclease subunit [Bryobacteraceae bacterium]
MRSGARAEAVLPGVTFRRYQPATNPMADLHDQRNGVRLRSFGAAAGLFFAVGLMAAAMFARADCGRLERLGYDRHERDLCREDGLYYFDEVIADAAVRAIETRMRFGKAEWSGKPFILQPWQKFIVGQLFGWRRESDGSRRFRQAYVEIPRKNGKSELAAAIGLLLLAYDGEGAPEVYSAATKRDQAKLVFNAARNIIRQSPDLKKVLNSFKNVVECERNGGTFTPLSADANTLDGLNVHCAIVDELHAHRGRELWDVIVSACGARSQPLIFAITTAGVGREGLCYEIRERAERMLTRQAGFDNDALFAFIATCDKGDDWRDEATWRKANPNLGVSVKEEFLREQCRDAIASPAFQNSFRRYYLNEWCEQAERWVDMAAWRACEDKAFGSGQEEWMERLTGRPCWVGVDLSKTTDLTAVSAVFPPEGDDERWRILCWGFVPNDRIEDRVRRDGVPYDAWARAGWLTRTPGNVVDYAYIAKRVAECAQRFDVREVCFDPWNATAWATGMMNAGHANLVEVRQGFKSLSPACYELDKWILSRAVGHNGDPVLNWCLSNVTIRRDANDNLAPDKARSTERIDYVSATLTAMSRAICFQDAPTGCGVYFA